MKQKSKIKKPNDDQVKSWKDTAAFFEDSSQFSALLKNSSVLNSSERRKLFGSGKTKPVSVRLPEEDLEAVKEIAIANHRPYQQLVVIAVQQYLDRVASSLQKKKSKDDEVA